MGESELVPVALRMLVDLVSAAAKVLAALYGASLLLAADALWTLYAWYVELNRRTAGERGIFAAAAGLLLAAAAVGLAWRAIGDLLAGYQGLGGPRPAAGALAAGALIVACREIAVRLIDRFAPGESPEGPSEIRYERLVSVVALALLAPAVLYADSLGFLDGSFGLLLALAAASGLIRIVYRRIEPFFGTSES